MTEFEEIDRLCQLIAEQDVTIHQLRQAINRLRLVLSLDYCEANGCEGFGVKGNHNIIDGKKICDYCHAKTI